MAPRRALRPWVAWLWRVVSYLAVAVVAALIGWHARSDLVQPATPQSKLDVAESGVVVTLTGDLRAQMTVANYGDIGYQLSFLTVDGDRQKAEATTVGPGGAFFDRHD